ncbi:hypothetical protein ACQCU1_16020 [Sutcliffiella horikoshii]|uniref:hypothetical protein n=1 Tax=Sutcliffiella horikoshii TaxID=79883 RepID=UPI003CF74020
MIKKIALIAISAFAIPIGIAFLGGGGYILVNLILGVSIAESFQALQEFQAKIQPYMKYMVILMVLPLIMKFRKPKEA